MPFTAACCYSVKFYLAKNVAWENLWKFTKCQQTYLILLQCFSLWPRDTTAPNLSRFKWNIITIEIYLNASSEKYNSEFESNFIAIRYTSSIIIPVLSILSYAASLISGSIFLQSGTIIVNLSNIPFPVFNMSANTFAHRFHLCRT